MTDVSSIETTRRVSDYYNKSHRLYRWFYIDKVSLGIHYGFWGGTSSKSEATTNQYREVARLLKPVQGDLILDSGCGIGGASLWLADNTPAKYIGITISDAHLRDATRYKLQGQNGHKTRFYRMNYFNMGFPDETFNKAFGIESVCHSYPDPCQLFSELHRVLKPGGRLVMSDGILSRQPSNSFEQKLADNFCKGFCMAGWCTVNEVLMALQKSGFVNIKFIDKTNEIRGTVRELYRTGILTLPLHFFRLLGLVSKQEAHNTLAVLAQKKMYDLGLFGYGIFYAEKDK